MEQNDSEKRPTFNLDESPDPASLIGGAKRSSRPRQSRGRQGSSLNKRTTILLLVVLFAAMALLVFSQMGSKAPEAPQQAQTQTTVPEGQPVENEVSGSMPAPPDAPGMGQTAEVAPLAEQALEPSAEPVEGGGIAVEEPSATQQPAAPMPVQAPEQTPATPQKPAQIAQQSAQQQPAPPAPAPAAETAAPAQQAAPEPSSAPAAAEGPKNKLTNVKFEPGNGAVVMRISTDLPLAQYKYFTLEGPRVVVDLLGPFKAHATSMAVPANGLVKSIRIGNHPDKLRLVADISGGKAVKVDVVRDSEKQLSVKVTAEP